MLEVVGISIATFLGLLLLHILSSRIYTPKSQDKYIMFHYAIVPVLLFAVLVPFEFFHLIAVDKAVLSYLLYFVISSSWIASFPAIYAACPTLIITMVIQRNRNGTSAEELRTLLSLKANSVERIEDALKGGLIQESENQIKLTALGQALYLFFKTYRGFLGLRLETK